MYMSNHKGNITIKHMAIVVIETQSTGGAQIFVAVKIFFGSAKIISSKFCFVLNLPHQCTLTLDHVSNIAS